MINVGTNPIFGLENIPSFKNGSGIHIKKENQGKFTKSAKAAGESVQEHAAHVLSDPNATPLLKKRANFAKNAAKWKHQLGGHIVKAGDNLWDISKKYTGDSKNYQKIAKANNISDSDKIFVGQKITIPSDLLPSKPGAPLPAMYNRPKQPKMKLYGFKQEL